MACSYRAGCSVSRLIMRKAGLSAGPLPASFPHSAQRHVPASPSSRRRHGRRHPLFSSWHHFSVWRSAKTWFHQLMDACRERHAEHALRLVHKVVQNGAHTVHAGGGVLTELRWRSKLSHTWASLGIPFRVPDWLRCFCDPLWYVALFLCFLFFCSW